MNFYEKLNDMDADFSERVQGSVQTPSTYQIRICGLCMGYIRRHP